MKPSKYVGYAGQLDVMAELSMRGYNVAAPGVDIGDDVLVLNEDTGKIDRVQVKTARKHTKSSSNKKNRLIYEFLVHKPRITENLSKAGSDPYFIFAMLSIGWPKYWTFVIISKSVLAHLVKENDLGTKSSRPEQIRLSIEIDSVGNISFFKKRNVKISLNAYKNDWTHWPPIPPYDT